MKTNTTRKFLAVLVILSAWMAGPVSTFAADRDDQIEKTFKNSQAYRTQLKNSDVSIDSDGGVVTLKGEVANESQKSIAVQTARDIPGVQSVKDELRVAKGPSDEWIATEVRGALLLHKNVSLVDTKVSAENGVVTLTGSAENEAEKALAEKYAADVKGVKRVENKIQVAAAGTDKKSPSSDRSLGEKVDDATITARIKYALSVNHATSALRTEVKTENGVVTVRGEAKNPAEKDLVTKLATSVEGVRDVRNAMIVASD